MSDRDIALIQQMLDEQDYVADRGLAMAVFLAKSLHKPLMVEGPAGVGKTEIAKVMACALGADLIRLQCYEGLDASTALYEWNYQRQLLYLKLEENSEKTTEEKEASIFGDSFLLALAAKTAAGDCVPEIADCSRSATTCRRGQRKTIEPRESIGSVVENSNLSYSPRRHGVA